MARIVILFLIFSLAVVSMDSCQTEKSCVCTNVYAPVCGANGKTYANPCVADCEGISYIDGECPVNGIGQVTFSGSGNCGYLIRIFEVNYKPDTLAPIFEVEGKWVNIRYRRLNRYFTCEALYGHYQLIEVLEIKKII